MYLSHLGRLCFAFHKG